MRRVQKEGVNGGKARSGTWGGREGPGPVLERAGTAEALKSRMEAG